jgi:hypothetical protein
MQIQEFIAIVRALYADVNVGVSGKVTAGAAAEPG